MGGPRGRVISGITWHDRYTLVPIGGVPLPMATDTDTRPNDLAGPRPRPRGRRMRRFLREVVSWPTVITCVLSVLLGMPAAVLLTPDQKVTVAGQQIAVGARPPTLSLSGPAQLVQIGNT